MGSENLRTKHYNKTQKWLFNIIKRENPEFFTEYSVLKGYSDSNYCGLCKFIWNKKYYNIYSDTFEDTYCLNCFFRDFNLTKEEHKEILKLSPFLDTDILLNKFWETLQNYFIQMKIPIDKSKPVYRRNYFTIKIYRNEINLPFGFTINWERPKKKRNFILSCRYETGDSNFILAIGDFKEKIMSQLEPNFKWKEQGSNLLYIESSLNTTDLSLESKWREYVIWIYQCYIEIYRVFLSVYSEMKKTPNKFGYPV